MNDQWCGNCDHRIIKDGVDYCPKRDLIFFRRLEMEETAPSCPFYDSACEEKKQAFNESYESVVDEIKRYRSEYAEQGNEEDTK